MAKHKFNTYKWVQQIELIQKKKKNKITKLLLWFIY